MNRRRSGNSARRSPKSSNVTSSSTSTTRSPSEYSRHCDSLTAYEILCLVYIGDSDRDRGTNECTRCRRQVPRRVWSRIAIDRLAAFAMKRMTVEFSNKSPPTTIGRQFIRQLISVNSYRLRLDLEVIVKSAFGDISRVKRCLKDALKQHRNQDQVIMLMKKSFVTESDGIFDS